MPLELQMSVEVTHHRQAGAWDHSGTARWHIHRLTQTLCPLKNCQCFKTMLSVTEII